VTKQELVALLDVAVEILTTNKQAATEQLLSEADGLISKARENRSFLFSIGSLLGFDPNTAVSILTSAEQFVEIERKILANTDKVIAAIESIKSRPFILAVIAAAL